MVEIRRLFPSELDWANERYTETDFALSSASDLVAVAEVDGVRAGVGRIVQMDAAVGELGGVYVLAEFRGRAVATAIVAFLLAHSSWEQLWCIPFARLEGFYRRFGFLPASNIAIVPDAVHNKLRWCQGHYDDPVCLLVRDATTR